jgi:Flp pilus assembly protein TadD
VIGYRAHMLPSRFTLTGCGLLLVTVVAAGCASLPRPTDAQRLRELIAAAGTIGETIDDPLALEPAASDRVLREVGHTGTELERLTRLSRWLSDPAGLHFRYDLLHTRTAAQAWATASGDCLSYAHLFNAAGRLLGVPMRYVRYQAPRSYEDRDGRLVVVTHVGSLYRAEHGTVLVELTGEAFSSWMSDYEELRDDEAAALHASNLAIERLASGDAEAPARLLRVLVAHEPRLPELRNNLGAILLRRGDYDEALAVLQRAIVDFPSYVPLYVNASQAARAAGRRELAEALAAQADAPWTDPFVPFVQGALLLDRGQPAAAVEVLQRVAELKPDSATFQVWLARGLVEVGRRREARAAYERARKLNPHHQMLDRVAAALGLR